MAIHIRRREFIFTLGGAAAAWPLAARAQQTGRPVRIGYLSATSAPDVNIERFRQGMSGIGYLEGRDFIIEARFSHRDYGRRDNTTAPQFCRGAAAEPGWNFRKGPVPGGT